MKIINFTDNFACPEGYAAYRGCMYHPTWESFSAQVKRIAENPACTVWAAEDTGQILGILVLEQEAENAVIQGIAVLPEYRGRGVGRMLVEWARTFGLPLTAETDANAKGFYEKCGFTVTSHVKTFPNGQVTRYFCKRV